MRYARSSEFRMKLKRIPESWGARPALAIILVGSFHRNLPHFFFEHGHKSCGSRREGGKTKETEGSRRRERRRKKGKKKEEEEEELRRTERGDGGKVGENVKKVSLNFTQNLISRH